MTTVGLRRSLGLSDAVAIGAGSMIGAGVFVVWAPAADAAGTGLAWGLLLAAAVAGANATSSAQLAAVHPASGGTYIYGRRQLGPGWGHLAGWGFVVGKTASCAAMALAVGSYTWPGHERLVAITAVVGITFVNIGGLQRTAAVTKGLLTISLAVLALVVVAGWSSETASADRWTPLDGGFLDVVRSAGFLFFAFAGYARIATLGEEVRDPARTIPRAIALALGAVLVVYIVVGATALAAVPVTELGAASAPLRLVVEAGRWPGLAGIVRAGAAVAALGALLNLIPGVSRTALAMARERDLPTWLAVVDGRRSVPVRAELTVAVTVIAVIALTGIRSAIAVSGVAVLTYYAITNAAALTLSDAQRRWPRAVPVLGLIGCVGLIAALPLRDVAVGVAVLVAGAGVRTAVMTRR